MKLTKFEHSCFILEKDGNALVVDPGNWATNFIVPENVIGVVVTHEHADHFDIEKLRSIAQKNPSIHIYAPADVAAKAPDLPMQRVETNEIVEVGGFTLQFVGGSHATIHSDFHPPFQNLGVVVDSMLYHPGDSLFVPEQTIKVLSLPIVAPWTKASESMDFLARIKPEIAFPSHDAILSESGIGLYDRWHALVAEKQGTTYVRIKDSIEI